ncbi:MAG TPA: amidophosphoribosyltransferase, partial [Alteromonas australica]|nr:amidophosphoribosyltransferase [Alteromonas australica]HBU50510.1 amidophosphoribosyltransferase [Alteromonas australica]
MKRALNVSCLLCYQASPTPVCQWCEDDIFSFDTRKYKE